MSRATAVETARRILDDTSGVAFSSPMDAADAIGSLRGAVRGLLGVLDAEPVSARLAAQRDEEFMNLARATRGQIGKVRAAVEELDAFERALSAMLAPKGGADR
ncbi:hypothetical protein ACGRHY_18890 [Streptomyces sp. HK10]|uniref:hypothetical protein n=1 Tax=Streptomyces sp. HK10 TaxID=3373255 RepID=UPI003748D17B